MSEKLKELLTSLDEKVFTEDLNASITEAFETAVSEAAEMKALEISAEKIEEKVSELDEKAEEFKAILVQEAEEKEAVLLDQVDAYLEKVVDDFVAESQEALDESIKAEKADMIIEAMEAMLISTGVEVAQIVEAKDSLDAESKLGESVVKVDALVEENITLEKENAKLLKMGIIAEMKSDMKVVDAEKFGKLADLVEFDSSKEYLAKLDTIKESIGTQKVQEKIEEKVQDKKEEKLGEKVKLTEAFSHLI